MSLKQQLLEDMKSAMKTHDSAKLNAVRFLLSEIKNIEIDKGEQTDQQLQELIRKMVKQLEETNQQYEQAGRPELVAENQAQITVYRSYLPPAMSEAELAGVVTQVMAANPGQGMGPLIGLVRQKTEGRVDGALIAAEVKRQLGL